MRKKGQQKYPTKKMMMRIGKGQIDLLIDIYCTHTACSE